MSLTLRLSLTSLCLISAIPACFAQTLSLAGSDYSQGNSYTYLGNIGTIGAPTLQNGLAYRLWADYLTYQYKGGQNTTYKAQSTGLEAGLGYLWGNERIQASVFLSATVRDTSISPADASNASDGTQTAAKISGDLVFPILSGLTGNIGASYATNNGAYWGRLRVMKDFGSFSFGPEFAASGSDTYEIHQYGLAVTNIRLGKVSIGAKAGLTSERNMTDKPYVGMDLSVLF